MKEEKRTTLRAYVAPKLVTYGKVSELTKAEYRYLMGNGNNGQVSG